MIDRAKRNTLKALSVAVAGVATAGHVVAGEVSQLATENMFNRESDITLARIEVTTRISVVNNDIEIVLKNVGSEPTTITQMTPSVVRVARGEFNVGGLLNNGPVTIEAGKSVSVPLTRKAVKLWSAASDGVSTPLAANLRKTMSIVTDSSAFASVDIPDYLAIA